MNHEIGLERLLQLLLAFLVLPLGVWLVLAMVQITGQARIEQIQQQVQRIDNRIGQGMEVSADSNSEAVDPCSNQAIQRIKTSHDLNIEYIRSSVNHCTWKYTDGSSGQIIAVDYWKSASYQIELREYYGSEGVVIVQDFFNPQDDDCFKNRKYFDDQNKVFIQECFSEAGIPHAKWYKVIGNRFIERSNNLRSPIPPIFFSFYR